MRNRGRSLPSPVASTVSGAFIVTNSGLFSLDILVAPFFHCLSQIARRWAASGNSRTTRESPMHRWMKASCFSAGRLSGSGTLSLPARRSGAFRFVFDGLDIAVRQAQLGHELFFLRPLAKLGLPVLALPCVLSR